MSDEKNENKTAVTPVIAPGPMEAEPAQEMETAPRHVSPKAPEPGFWNDDEKEQAYRSRWIEVQSDFVDDPSDSVRNADELIAELIENVSITFSRERSTLEEKWVHGNDVTTEDLRVSMTRYRDLFDRLMRVGDRDSQGR